VTVLDPACGSGNFLYLALRLLKDLEQEVIDWGAERLGSTLALEVGRPPDVPGPSDAVGCP
jgi:type I restriction-modification system DNA methylase subunit